MKAINKMVFKTTLFIMIIALVAACSSNNNTSSTPSTTPSNTPSTTESTPAAPQERVTLKVTVWDRGNTPPGYTITDNLMTRWVQENFGEPNNIDVEYVAIPRSDEISTLNVQMAAGSAPDIIISYNRGAMYNFAKQGGLHELDDVVDEHGKVIKEFMSSSLPGGFFDGKMYTINNPRINMQKYTSYIRQDWLDQLDIPMPTTTDEAYDALVAFKNAKLGGNKTIPLGFSLAPSSYEPIIWSFIKETSNEARYLRSVTIGSREYPILMDGHKDGVQFLNKLYNEGLIDPDFALDRDRKVKDEGIVNGNIGMFSEDTGGSTYGGDTSVASVLKSNFPDSNLQPLLTWTNFEGKYRQPAYTPFGFHIAVPIFSDRKVEAVKFINWMSQEEVRNYLAFGKEGVHHDIVDGFPVVRQDDATKELLYNSGDMRLFANGLDFGSVERNIEFSSINVDEQFREDSMKAREYSNVDAVPQPIAFGAVLDSEAKHAVIMLDKYYELLVNSMMAKPQEFDQVYEARLKDFMDTAGTEVINERTEAYNEGDHNWQY